MDYEKMVMEIVAFIRDYYQRNNLGGAVLGISGGKDSAVVAALMCKAIGSENVVGITLPCHSIDEDKIDAKKISDFYGFKLYDIDLTSVFDTFKKEISKIGNYTDEECLNSDINIKPRLRMMSCYYMAALLSEIKKKTYLVVGTSNKSELFVGYFTKGGDSVHDIAPIADLTVSEVIGIGEVLDVPREILYKKPSDGLSNFSDEDKLGVSYDEIERYMNGDRTMDIDTIKRIEKLHNSSRHKFQIPTYLKENK